MAEHNSPFTPHTSNFYRDLLTEIKECVRSAQYEALKAVNKELVGLYWDIGRIILERQETESWGNSVVKRLSTDLRREFPGVSGFSVQNLWYMRQFYSEYHDNERLQPLVGEIAWAHNLAIMSKCKDPLKREFYLRMTRKFGWSKNVLIHQIDNQTYEKSLLGQTNFDQALTPELRAQAKLAVKDEYTFDFLELGKEHSERELERALIADVVTGKVDVRHFAPPPNSEDLQETVAEIEPLDDVTGELDEEALTMEVEE